VSDIKESKSHFVLDKDDPKSKKKATFERHNEDISQDRPKRANGFLMNAGELYEESPWSYVGSAAVHFYRHNMGRSDYQFAVQVLLGDVPEPYALHGWKELQAQLMLSFGKKPPKELE